MVSVFVFCWGPYAFQSILSVFGYAEVSSEIGSVEIMLSNIFQTVPLLLSVMALQFAKSSILWNPVIYVLLNKSVWFDINFFWNYWNSTFQFHKAFLSQLADPLKSYISKKLNVEEKSLSETEIGRRQHPKMFGRFKTLWEAGSKSRWPIFLGFWVAVWLLRSFFQ